jgi:hypothetical protein
MKDSFVFGEKIKVKLGTSEQNETVKNYCERNIDTVNEQKKESSENKSENPT